MECNLSTEEVISLNDTKILDENSQKLLKKYNFQWEMDEYVWVFFDGRMFTTNNGKVCVFTEEELKTYIEEIEENLNKYKELLN